MARTGWVWFLSFATASTLWCASASRSLGPTFDEPYFAWHGLRFWHDPLSDGLVRSGAMPLAQIVEAIPVAVWEWLRGVPLDEPTTAHEGLPLARHGALVFWFLLLYSGYRAGKLWSCEAGGCLAVAFLAVEPILLGHASLATTDLPLTACLVFLVVIFKTGRDGAWRRRVLFPSLVAGLALLTKASALVFIPVCLSAVEGERYWQRWRRGESLPWTQSIVDLAQIGVGAIAVVFLLCPMAWKAIEFQLGHNVAGHGLIYLLGDVSPNGFWYYFLAAVVLKTSLALLLLATILLVRPRYLFSAPTLAAAGLLLLSPTYRVQIGVRLVLPAVAFLAIGVAIALGRWLAERSTIAARRMSWTVIGAALLWTAAQAVRVWPHGIAYTNELFGGTANGYLALSDSNYDWGQGIPDLVRWRQRHAHAPVAIWYFGRDDRVEEFGFRPANPGACTTWEEMVRVHQGHYLAVGTSWPYGLAFELPGAKLLREHPFAARTTTFLIYDFTTEP
jgi:hypothetical protein